MNVEPNFLPEGNHPISPWWKINKNKSHHQRNRLRPGIDFFKESSLNDRKNSFDDNTKEYFETHELIGYSGTRKVKSINTDYDRNSDSSRKIGKFIKESTNSVLRSVRNMQKRTRLATARLNSQTNKRSPAVSHEVDYKEASLNQTQMEKISKDLVKENHEQHIINHKKFGNITNSTAIFLVQVNSVFDNIILYTFQACILCT